MDFVFSKEKQVGILAIHGRIDAGNIDELKKKFGELISGTINFIFDLTGVVFLDSTGLGGLVSCLRIANDLNGTIKIYGLQAKAKMVFNITGAYNLFEIIGDIKSGIEEFKV
jgi:anti-sigma B factor antagonist